MQDYGVNLICIELMISVLSAVTEIERENILVQTIIHITNTYLKASNFELIDLPQIFIMKSRKANQMLKASKSK